MPTTRIRRNGSELPHQPPASIDELIALLDDPKHVLNPAFETFGGFSSPSEYFPGGRRYLGRFQTRSHVFSIDTNDPDVIAKLEGAIQRHLASERYHIARIGYRGALQRGFLGRRRNPGDES